MIPKVIHYCWFGKNPLPDSAKKCIESWKKYCPDYQIIEWNESNYRIDKNEYMKEAYAAKKWAFVSDYARLDIIYSYGGVYLDTDVELIKSLNELLIDDGFMGFEGENYVAPGLGFGAIKEHPVIAKMMEIYHKRHFINPDGSYDMTSIPVLVTEMLVNMGLRRIDSKQIVDKLTIYPKDFFCPMDFQTGNVYISDRTFSIHWYDSSWYSGVEKQIVKVERFFNKRSMPHLARCSSLPLRVIRKLKNISYKKL